jgi:hypothetical protein
LDTLAVGLGIEPPPIIKPRRRRTAKGGKEENTALTKAAVNAAVGISLRTIFKMISGKFGTHWELSDRDTNELVQAIDDALETLPEGSYEKLLEQLGQIAPWIALAYTSHTIITPRIAATRAAKRRAKAGAVEASELDRDAQSPIPGNGYTHTNFSLDGSG